MSQSSKVHVSLDEAEQIAEVLRSADNFCTECARDLADQMQRIAPDHNWRILVLGEDEDGAER